MNKINIFLVVGLKLFKAFVRWMTFTDDVEATLDESFKKQFKEEKVRNKKSPWKLY